LDERAEVHRAGLDSGFGFGFGVGFGFGLGFGSLISPLGPLGFEGAQHRQTLRPSRRRDPQQSPESVRIAVKDLEDPAVQCRGTVLGSYWLAEVLRSSWSFVVLRGKKNAQATRATPLFFF